MNHIYPVAQALIAYLCSAQALWYSMQRKWVNADHLLKLFPILGPHSEVAHGTN